VTGRPQPTRADHDRFCQTEGWRRVRNARGKQGTHHVTYELDLPDGRVLRTRVSHPPDRTDYGPRLWAHILRDQLHVTAEEFWACVRDGIRPGRGEPRIPEEALPAELAYLLVHRVGLRNEEVARLTLAEAIERLSRFWQSGEQ
jgi:hypothetical protein